MAVQNLVGVELWFGGQDSMLWPSNEISWVESLTIGLGMRVPDIGCRSAEILVPWKKKDSSCNGSVFWMLGVSV